MYLQISDDQRSLLAQVRDFANNVLVPSAALRDEEERFDRNLFTKLGELGLTGLLWPQIYGGAGWDDVTYAMVIEELSRGCASTGVMLSVHTSLVGWSLYKYGTEEQKQSYLLPLAKGRKLGAYSLTENDSGSDAGAMRTTAKKQAGGYILNGTKIFVTSAGEADIYVVFAVTDLQRRTKGISAFLVDKGTPGFHFGKKEKKLGIRSSPTREIILDDCRVPNENLLGHEGDGFKIALAALDGGRIGIAAQAVGIAQAALDVSIAFAKRRRSSGGPLTMEAGIADMAARIEAARLLTCQAAWRKSSGLPYAKQSAMAKLFASDTAMQITGDALQMLGIDGTADARPL